MKTNYLKKCISVLLSVAMLASLFAVSFTASAEGGLVVDGKDYQIGDIVELKGDLQVNNWLMNGQVEIPYETEKLQFVEGQTEEEMFPTLKAQNIPVFYNNLAGEGKFLFNFSVPTEGADFTQSGTLYSIKFKVVGTGETKLSDAAKIIDMKSYNFEGSPENQTDFTMVPVVNEETGTILEEKGQIVIDSAPAVVDDVLVVDGVTYGLNDTFTFSGDMQADKWLMNTQMEMNFDKDKLQIVSVEYPVLDAAGITVYGNYSNQDGWFTFNFSDPAKGADFTESGKLYAITFKVVGTGTTTLGENVEIIDMATFPFEGSPEGQTEPFAPVDITDGNGGIKEGAGSLDNTVAPPAAKTLTVDGKTYNVGETFKFVGELQLNKWLMNAQYLLNFDNTKLEIIDTAYPALEAAGAYVVENPNNDEGWYRFNFSDIENGIDFTKGGNLYEVTFRVIGGGETSLKDKADMEVLSTFPFEGSPADYEGDDIDIYNVLDEEGNVKPEEGNIEHVVDPEPVVTETLNLDGTEYNVGDTGTYNIDLNTLRWIMNGQFKLNFEADKIQITNISYPKLEEAGIAPVENCSNEDGFFTFNFLDIEKGIDFTNGGTLVSIDFEVVGTGTTSLVDNSKFDVLSTFNFDGSPADPENQGTIIEIVDITDGQGGVNPDAGTATYYYGEPTPPVEKFVVNGYEVKEGDIVEYRIWVKNDDYWLVNSEFDVLYTNQYLTLQSVTYPGLEKIEDYIVDNQIVDSGLTESQGKPAGEVLFNFSNIHSGVDFTQGAYMAILRFEVHESTDPNVPAQGSSVIELNGNVVNDMYVFPFAGNGADHSINDKKDLVNVIGENGLPTTTEFELQTIINPVDDWSELQAAYDKWSQLDKTGYTPESVEALQKVLDETKAMLDDLNAGLLDGYNQEMIDQQKEILEAAGAALVVDKSELIALIGTAQGIVDDTETLYIPETIEALKTAIAAAQAVVDDENATVEDVAAAIVELQKAIDAVKTGAYLGDADYSGVVDIDDATLVQMYIAKMLPNYARFYEILADVDKNETITISDATEIQKIIAHYRDLEIIEFTPSY